MEDCLFCKIIAGAVPAHTIYEDDKTYAFLDINPVNPGHTLVIPKAHTSNLYEIPEDDWLAVTRTVRLLAPKIKEAVDADGINIEMNNEKAAGQIIFHAHVHIVPRINDDDLRHWPGNSYQEGEDAAITKRIISLL